MSNAPLSDDELPATGDPLPEEEPSWLERLLARFGLGEEPDLREVIEDALARGKEAGGDTFSAQERAMLRNILRFGKLTVEDVMVPRADIIAVEDTITIAELLRVFREAEHSRLPVYNETLDDPRGMIHIRDLMSWITTAAEKDEANLDLGAVDLARPSAPSTSSARFSTCRRPCRCSIFCSACNCRGFISPLSWMNMAARTVSSRSRI